MEDATLERPPVQGALQVPAEPIYGAAYTRFLPLELTSVHRIISESFGIDTVVQQSFASVGNPRRLRLAQLPSDVPGSVCGVDSHT